MITSILITAYLFGGVVFMTLSEDSRPDVIQNYKSLQIIIGVLSVILWLPWLLLNLCFIDRDIWFRLKEDDRFRAD